MASNSGAGQMAPSVGRPRPELLGVQYGPDVLDPVAGDVERHHHHGDAVLLGDQAGLAVDRALQDRQAECPAGDIDVEARDLLAAFDRAELGGDEAAAVAGRRGVGVEQADQGVDVLGLPRLLEVPDDVGLLGGRAVAGACDARMRRRAEEASWRQAAGVRPTISATSAKE